MEYFDDTMNIFSLGIIISNAELYVTSSLIFFPQFALFLSFIYPLYPRVPEYWVIFGDMIDWFKALSYYGSCPFTFIPVLLSVVGVIFVSWLKIILGIVCKVVFVCVLSLLRYFIFLFSF